MQARTTDWSLAVALAAAGGTGLWTLVTGREADWWVFALHGAAGYLTALLLAPKLARVARRIPAAMIFTPCKDGLSHNEAESILPEEAADGCQVLLEAILARANRAA